MQQSLISLLIAQVGNRFRSDETNYRPPEEAYKLLKGLTGQDFGYDEKAWRDWYKATDEDSLYGSSNREPDDLGRNALSKESIISFSGRRIEDWQPVFETFKVKEITLEMCLVPPGRFLMGSDDPDYPAEHPAHSQLIDTPYWVGIYPITNAQWRTAVTASNGLIDDPQSSDRYAVQEYANHPVGGVSWQQCQSFVSWLGPEWKLPTEREWEYAARGPNSLIFPWGNEFIEDNVLYYRNHDYCTEPVGQRPRGASWTGAHDMSGNVWEWTTTVLRQYPYSPHDGREDPESELSRVIKGGWWRSHKEDVSAIARNHCGIVGGIDRLGLRIVRKA